MAADYGPDPIGARVYELRLSIVQELVSAAEDPQEVSIPDSLKELMSQPVPTATPRSPSATPTKSKTKAPTETNAPAPTEAPLTATPGMSNTPTNVPSSTPTSGAGPGLDCSRLQITNVWIDDGDEVRARVRNQNHRRAYLTKTVFSWPDVPPPAHVDWMRFDVTYFNHDDHSSPTISEGTWIMLGWNSSKTWQADFDDEPVGGIYGNFRVTLTFEYPGWGSCVIAGSTFRAQPTASPTRTPTVTKTPSPTRTPTETESPTPEISPSATTEEPTIEPSETPPEPTATESPEPGATP